MEQTASGFAAYAPHSRAAGPEDESWAAPGRPTCVPSEAEISGRRATVPAFVDGRVPSAPASPGTAVGPAPVSFTSRLLPGFHGAGVSV